MELTKIETESINLLFKIAEKIFLKYKEFTTNPKRDISILCEEIKTLKKREDILLKKLNLSKSKLYIKYINHVGNLNDEIETIPEEQYQFLRVRYFLEYYVDYSKFLNRANVFCSTIDLYTDLSFRIYIDYAIRSNKHVKKELIEQALWCLANSPIIEEKILKQNLTPSNSFMDTSKCKKEMILYIIRKQIEARSNNKIFFELKENDEFERENLSKVDSLFGMLMEITKDVSGALKDDFSFMMNLGGLKAFLAMLTEKNRKTKYLEIIDYILKLKSSYKTELSKIIDDCIEDIEINLVPNIHRVSFIPDKRL